MNIEEFRDYCLSMEGVTEILNVLCFILHLDLVAMIARFFTPCNNHNELNLILLRHTLANRGRIADMASCLF